MASSFPSYVSLEPSSSAREPAQAPASATPDSSGRDARQQRQDQQRLAELASRDRDVRAHEQAHAAVGGPYAGAPGYSYSRGPDGRLYATAGEVAIDLAVVANDPAATVRKMDVVVRAALAPAEPSAQDLRVAAQAQAQMVQARAELQRGEGAPQPAQASAQSSVNVQHYLEQDRPSPPGTLVDLRV
ncbi:putative metalloprotease CJM1_0395 family protein [Pseudomonas benzenivorans]|uniref:Metalloprotease CJM1_0395 family protein n=1 Tax=Pseudomonas benzenivorans TaxID=556533 RepID=A0ABZ0PUH8_9PSED|nr:putative metalloprotease CJM1_0395 family protein [Pseudomonas benzenivorans]WPC04756.1 putative metalloprotease CJM1_0395 family protein [Pseudomonas benzenivorans]